jgi:hypothetical protein
MNGHYLVHNSPALDPVLSAMNPFRFLTLSCLICILTLLPVHADSPKCHLLFTVSGCLFCMHLLFPMRATFPTHFLPSDFITQYLAQYEAPSYAFLFSILVPLLIGPHHCCESLYFIKISDWLITFPLSVTHRSDLYMCTSIAMDFRVTSFYSRQYCFTVTKVLHGFTPFHYALSQGPQRKIKR